MATIVITLSLSEELLGRIDQAAREQSLKRSAFLRAAAMDRLRVVDAQNAQLAAAVLRADVPTEETILDLLKLQDRQRAVAQWRLEHRRELRERNQARRATKEARARRTT